MNIKKLSCVCFCSAAVASLAASLVAMAPPQLAAPTDFVTVSSWAVSRDGEGQRFSVNVDLNTNDETAFLAYAGFPTLPDCFPVQTQYGPPACPAEFAEDYPALRDNWVSWKISDLEEPLYFGTPFTIAWVEVRADREVDPESIWLFMIDVAGTHSTMFRTADHRNVQAQYTDDQWFMHKDGKGFTVPIIIVGIQIIGLFEDVQVGWSDKVETIDLLR